MPIGGYQSQVLSLFIFFHAGRGLLVSLVFMIDFLLSCLSVLLTDELSLIKENMVCLTGVDFFRRDQNKITSIGVHMHAKLLLPVSR